MTYDLFPEGMFGVSTAIRDVLCRRGQVFLNDQFNSAKMFAHQTTCEDPGGV